MAASSLGTALTRATDSVGRSDVLDAPAKLLRWLGDLLVADKRWARVLHGAPIGHAAHPLLTDLPLGMWMSSTALDLVGPKGSERGADRLLGLGLLAAVPTAVTGAADWVSSERGDPDTRRIGTAHALLNSTALGLYGASWFARRAGMRRGGVALSLLAGGTAVAGGYLGGHMTTVLKLPPTELSSPEA
jgi:uncharacterized membrane protein